MFVGVKGLLQHMHSSVAGGGFFSLFLDKEGIVWSCGRNDYGQLGFAKSSAQTCPKQVKNVPRIQSVAAGFEHSLFLDFNTSAWACGEGNYGALGLSDRNHRFSPVEIPSTNCTAAISA